MSRFSFFALSILLISCSDKSVELDSAEDSAAPVDDNDDNDDDGCEVIEVGWDGPENPVVGDTWTVWPVCDGAVVLGATVVRVDPTDSATLDENQVTFALVGTCVISVQIGAETASVDVDVSEG